MSFASRMGKAIFKTEPALDETDVTRGLKLLNINAVCGMSAGALQGGVFLSAFALALGATNYEIGLLTTIAFVSQFMQIPGLFLVQAAPKRRAITVLCAGVSRLLWVFIIAIPFFFAGTGVSFLFIWLALAGFAMALCVPAWNSLLRAIVPVDRMGTFFSRRLMMGTSLALALTLGGGIFVDWWQVALPGYALYSYSILFGLGMVFGLVELVAIGRLPEPTMPRQDGQDFLKLVSTPVQDANFRRLLFFIAPWTFAVNMAAPFFIIYMLNRIGLSLFTVTLLATIGQVVHVVFLRIWGRLADRFSNKAVLSFSCPMFLLAILAWVFTTMPESYFLTLPLLVAIHILSGISTAGVNLSSSNIALKLSPEGAAHSYMTVFSLCAAAAGATAPLVGGVMADFFAVRELSLMLNWSEPARQLSVYAVHFKALDFLFGAAFVVGFFALNRLARVQEAGEVPQGHLSESLLNEMMGPLRSFAGFGGLNKLAVPLTRVLGEEEEAQAEAP